MNKTGNNLQQSVGAVLYVVCCMWCVICAVLYMLCCMCCIVCGACCCMHCAVCAVLYVLCCMCFVVCSMLCVVCCMCFVVCAVLYALCYMCCVAYAALYVLCCMCYVESWLRCILMLISTDVKLQHKSYTPCQFMHLERGKELCDTVPAEMSLWYRIKRKLSTVTSLRHI